MERVNTVQTATPNLEFARLASEEQIAKTVKALEANGIQTTVVETGDEAKSMVLGAISPGSSVYNSPSKTLDLIGLSAAIEESTTFQPLRARMHALDRATQYAEIRRLGATPDVYVGSVHAITEQGQVMIASALGNQLSAAVWGAGQVIWVAGTQKLIRTIDEGFQRIREYSHPLEDARTRQVYGQPSAINKILIVNGEMPGRIKIVLVKQNLGF